MPLPSAAVLLATLLTALAPATAQPSSAPGARVSLKF
jgi:hypothetical protein